MSCIFCSIVEKKSPSYTVYEDGESLAFLDIIPCAPGHVMVILKKHGVTIHDYSEKELGKLMNTVGIVSRGIEKAFRTDILSIGINHGERSGVPHLHVHIIPRFPNDGGGVIQSIVQQKGNDTLTEVQEKIKKSII